MDPDRTLHRKSNWYTTYGGGPTVPNATSNPYYNDLPDSVKQMYTQDPFDELKAGGASATVNIDAGWTNIKSITAFRYRSEEHTSELQSLMRISYAVFCLKKKN